MENIIIEKFDYSHSEVRERIRRRNMPKNTYRKVFAEILSKEFIFGVEKMKKRNCKRKFWLGATNLWENLNW